MFLLCYLADDKVETGWIIRFNNPQNFILKTPLFEWRSILGIQCVQNLSPELLFQSVAVFLISINCKLHSRAMTMYWEILIPESSEVICEVIILALRGRDFHASNRSHIQIFLMNVVIIVRFFITKQWNCLTFLFLDFFASWFWTHVCYNATVIMQQVSLPVWSLSSMALHLLSEKKLK